MGSKLKGLVLDEKDLKRFHSNYKKTGDCWEWTGSLVKTRGNYGRMEIKGTGHRAHRLSYYLHYKKDPGAMFVCHKCDNPKCVNPKHLFLGTPYDNMKDMIKKGRAARQDGMFHPCRKLTDKQVKEIRKKYAKGVTQADLHREYGMSRASICLIVNGKHWRNI